MLGLSGPPLSALSRDPVGKADALGVVGKTFNELRGDRPTERFPGEWIVDAS